MALFENANYDFIKWRWHAIALSAIVIIAGLAYGFARACRSASTSPAARSSSRSSSTRSRTTRSPGVSQSSVARAGHPGLRRCGANEKQIRIPQLIQEQDASLDQNARAVVDALSRGELPASSRC
jgi:hypothetical protein